MRHILVFLILALSLPAYAADPSSPTTQPADAPTTQPAGKEPITYKGKRIANEQAREMWQKYGKQVVKVDGKFYDVGRGLLEPGFIEEAPPAPGTLGTVNYKAWFFNQPQEAKVIEVSDGKIIIQKDNDARVIKPSVSEGIAPQMKLAVLPAKSGKYKTGDKFTSPILYVKTEDADSKPRQVWQEYAPVSEADFYDALRSGLELKKWVYVDMFKPKYPGEKPAYRAPFKIESTPVR